MSTCSIFCRTFLILIGIFPSISHSQLAAFEPIIPAYNKDIVYITDCEHPEGSLNENVVKIATECDYLIHDSHFTIEDLSFYKGWGHSSWKQCVDVAITARV